MDFNFFSATQIAFGIGTFDHVGSLAKSCGNKAFVITGGGSVEPFKLIQFLQQEEVFIQTFKINQEPSVTIVEKAVNLARESECDFVIGFGGGSVIDSAKAVAAMLTNKGSLLDYLEVVGKNIPLSRPGAPVLAIPTTAGTGSEVTRNAVLSVPDQKVKVSLRSPWILPRIALVDPVLTMTMPPAVTASSGMDAFTQLVESYLTPRANPITDQLARTGIQLVSRSIVNAYQDGSNLSAREDMSLASMISGITLTNAGLGAVHGFAGPIGGLFNVSHGEICASLLAPVFRKNSEIIKERDPGSPLLNRFTEIARIITGNPQAAIGDGVEWIENVANRLSIPRLSTLGIKEDMFEIIIEKSMKSSSMKGNPVSLSHQELTQILRSAL